MLVGDELLLLPKSAITIDHDSEGFASFSDFYTFRADHNGLSQLQVLVHRWRHTTGGDWGHAMWYTTQNLPLAQEL